MKRKIENALIYGFLMLSISTAMGVIILGIFVVIHVLKEMFN